MSLSPEIQAALIAFVGVVIGTLITAFSNWYSHQKQKELWELQQQTEHEKWLRDKLQEIYSNCIFFLRSSAPLPTSIGNSSGMTEAEKIAIEVEYSKLRFEADKLWSELHNEQWKWLNLLAVYHPFRGSKEYETFLEKRRLNKLSTDDIVELAARDPRLQ